jgi:hypothetical protein
MRKIRALAAALVVCGVATATAAVREDVDRIDAHRDRDEREARLAMPRTASGAIDVRRLIVEIRAGLTRGAHDIRFRDSTLSAQDAHTLRELAARFGFERVRIRDDGRRSVRVEFHDADGARDDAAARVEVRDPGRAKPRDVAQPPERVERAERAGRPDRAERNDRPERGDRAERADRSGRR